MDPNLAWAIASPRQFLVGYVVHSRGAFEPWQKVNCEAHGRRFAVVSLVSFGINTSGYGCSFSGSIFRFGLLIRWYWRDSADHIRPQSQMGARLNHGERAVTISGDIYASGGRCRKICNYR
jgi:hypothetical protein